MSNKMSDILRHVNDKRVRNVQGNQEIQPFHGYVTKPSSRAGFLISKGLMGSPWPANEMEGGKNFPYLVGGRFLKQGNEDTFYTDVESAIPPQDGLILSGGHSNNGRIIVNYTDQELEKLAGIKGGWPKHSVTSGSIFYATWAYHARHKTRGYRWYITKQNWDTTQRLTRAAFEPEPIYSDFSSYAPFWSYSSEVMNAWDNLSVVLPSRTGHQVLLCVWLVADTGMGFYQAFDLNFDGQGGGEGEGGGEGGCHPGNNHPAWSPKSVRYAIGDYVTHNGELYTCTQAHTSNSGWAPGVAFTLWKMIN